MLAPAGTPGGIPGEVLVSTFLGRHNQLNVRTDIGEFVVSAGENSAFDIGSAVTLSLMANKVNLID